jgi:hypothetical protein
MPTQTQRKTGKATEARKGTKQTAGQLKGIAPLGAKLASSLPIKTAVSRLAGVRPSRTRSFLAASTAAAAGGAVVYRLLRSDD